MTNQTWQPIAPLVSTLDAAAPGLWLCVVELLKPPFKLKITATGTWEWAPGRACSPDGEPAERSPADVLVTSAPLGSLVGKIGGSTCDKGDWLAAGGVLSTTGLTRPAVFAIGSSAIIISGSEAASIAGPLFLSMNDSPLRFQYHKNTNTPLRIALFEAVG